MPVDGHRTRAVEAVARALNYVSGTAGHFAPQRTEELARDIVDTVAEHTVETVRALLRAEEQLEKTPPG